MSLAETTRRRLRHTDPVTDFDRQQLAGQLSEAVTRRLAALALRLDASMALTKEQAVQRRIGESVAELNAVVDELRSIVLGLQQGGAPPDGLQGTVTVLALAAGARLGCTPRTTFEGALDDLPPVVADDLAAVAEEMLANVVKHAYAGTIELRLVASADSVLLEVRDDGVGPNDEPTSGKGLADMLGRAQAHAGTFAIEPNKDNDGGFGSVQRWWAPLGT